MNYPTKDQMATSRDEIRSWTTRDEAGRARWMIVVSDTFEHEEYPVYITDEDEYHKKVAEIQKGPDRIMEVYDLHMNIESQLHERRVWNGPR